MRFLWMTARKDLTRVLRDPMGLLAWMAMPLMMNALIAVIFQQGSPMPEGKLLLVDEDQTLVSGLIPAAFSREPLSKMVHVERVDAKTGQQRMGAGSASALLVIPVGFGRAVLRGEKSTLLLTKNPSERIVPGIIEQALQILLEGAFYLRQAAGPELDQFGSGPPKDADVATASVAIAKVAREITAYINPPLIQLESHVIAQQKQVPFPQMFFPGMLMLAIFGMGVSRSEDIWKERAQGTLRRALTTPRSLGVFFGGKVAALACLFATMGALGLVLARVGLSADIRNPVLATAWIACAGVALYLINILIQLMASDQRAGVMFGAFVLFLFGMLGGMFFPFEVMPPWLAAIGKFVPNGWLITRFKEIIGGQVDGVRMVELFGTVIGLSAVGFWVASQRLRTWSVS